MAIKLLTTILLVSLAISEGDSSNVLTLTDSTIDDAIKNNEHILIEFYAPWCGHCKRLAPEYEVAADLLKTSGANAVIAKVDATVEKNAASAWSIRGYPTLLYFNNGQMVEKYAGGRTGADISQFMITKSSTAKTEL